MNTSFPDRPTGEWTNEPDETNWFDEATGLRCRTRRNHVGALCGYVEVPTSHPHFACSYDAFDVEVHGGLTYSRDAFGTGREVGFDCAHCGDLIPDLAALGFSNGVYRNLQYVRDECTKLAKQLFDQS